MESRLTFLKFWPQNSFLGKFGPTRSTMSFFFLNWYKWNLEDADSYSTLNPFLGKFLKIRFKVFLIPFGLCPQSNNLVGF